MLRFIGILLCTFCFIASSEVINHGKCKITKYPPKQQKYWPDDIEVFNEKNEKYYLDKIEDKPVLIVFWATWCTYCLKELPSLDVLKKDFRKIPIEILAISEDYQGVESIQKFYQENEIRHLGLLYDYKFKLFGALNMTGLPYAFLLDQNKKIVLTFDGAVSWHDDFIRNMILDYVPGNPQEPKNTYRKEFLTQPNKSKIKADTTIQPKD